MTVKYYVLPDERRQMQEEAVKQAMVSIKGPVAFYEHWPGEVPHLTDTQEAREEWRSFCKLVYEDKSRRQRCREDYEARAASSTKPEISLCQFGVHNLVCPVKNNYGRSVTLIGGEFLIREKKAEAERKLKGFLEDVHPAQQNALREAWHKIPQIDGKDARYKLRELEMAGRNYLHALKQRSDFRYAADLATHDMVTALQALIADIEVLRIELKDTFGIGRNWEKRFDALIELCGEHHNNLERILGRAKPQYEYDSISKLIYECIEERKPQAKEREIDITADLEQIEDEEGRHKVLAVRMDRDSLKKALLNALDNAIKYSFSGTAAHPRWVEMVGRLRSVAGVPGYYLTISNLGIGIEEDELALVFEAGYQGRRRLDEDRSGYGMGLTFIKECIKKHGGGVAITSQPQQRTAWLTILQIWLPLHGPTDEYTSEG